jgi:hypothetical protein
MSERLRDAENGNESTLLLPTLAQRPQAVELEGSSDGNNKKASSHGSARFNVWCVVWGCIGITIGMALRGKNSFALPFSSDSPSLSAEEKKESSSSSRYNKVQTLGFQIYTAGAPAFEPTAGNDTEKWKNPECSGLQSYGVLGGWEFMCYLGREDPLVDVQDRVTIMQDAVERAHEQSSKDKSTLKVFVAPEFYWRGINGAYAFNEQHMRPNAGNCGAICHILEALQNIVADERFEDWLFVFGTAIASETLPTEDEYDYLFYNFAPIYRGYDPLKTDHHGKRFVLPKRYVSMIDFLTPRRHFDDALAKELVDEPLSENNLDSTVSNPLDFHQFRYDVDIWKKYKHELNDELGYTMIEYGWIVVDDITFTIEICYDHKSRTALTSYLADIVTGSTTLIPSTSFDHELSFVHIPKHQAQISLVSSAGMSIVPDAIVLTHNGTIFLQDGSTDDNSIVFQNNDEYTHQGLAFDGGTQAVQRQAVITSDNVFFEHRLLSAFEKHSIYREKGKWAEAVSGVFSTRVYEPMITVYEPIDIVSVAAAK